VNKNSKWTFNRQDESYQRPEFKGSLTPMSEKTEHTTQKPLWLMKDILKIHSNEGDLVLDCFAGSGTTGIACKIDGYEFVGLELSEEFTKISNKRIESFNEENLLLDDTTIYKNRNKTQKLDTNTKSKEQLDLF
jgi:DNA modification methylase